MTCSALAGAAGGSAVTAAQEFVNVEINEFDRVLRGLGLQRETSYFAFREHFIALHDGGAHAASAARPCGRSAKSLRSGCGMRGGAIALDGEGRIPNMLPAEEAHGYCVLAMQIDESSSGSGSCPSFIDAIKKITAAMNKDAQCPEKMMSMNQNDIQAESFLTSRSTACEKYSPRSPNGAPL